MAAPQMIADNQPIGGEAFITVDGATYYLGANNVKYSPANVERESVSGLSGVYGFRSKPRAPFIEFDFIDLGSQSVTSLAGKTASSVQMELANGKIISGSNMWTTTAVDIDAAEGTGHVKFEGGTVLENLASAA